MIVRAEQVFSICLIFFYSGALSGFIPEGHMVYAFKEFSAQAAFWVTCVLLIVNWKKAISLIAKPANIWLLLILILILISPLWSDHPLETSESTAAMLRVTAFAIYFAVRFNLKEQVTLLAITFSGAAILSFLFAVALPQYGVVGMGFISNMEDIVHTGKWRGVYIHKTMLGTNMALGIIICSFNFFIQPKFKKLMIGSFLLCIFMLIKSTTTGALVFLVFTVTLLPFYRALRLKMKFAIPLFSISFLIGGALLAGGVIAAEQFLSSLGKDITLTGRTLYWPLMLEKVWERPWLGYGYQAFWVGGWKGEVADIWRFFAPGNEPPHAHNGYINFWLDIGTIGISIFFIDLIFNYLRAIKFARATRSAEGLFPITFLTFWTLINLTESFLVMPAIFWIIYVSSALSMHRADNVNGQNPD